MRVLIFEAINGFQYEVVNVFAEELADGLKNLGWKVDLINLNQSPKILAKQIINIVNNGLDLTLHFNGFLVDYTNKFNNILYEYLKENKVVTGVILVDHPFYHFDRVRAFDTNTSFICMYSKGFLHSYKKYIDNSIFTAQLMHGGSYSKYTSSKKIYDVIMAGTIVKPVDFKKQLKSIGNNDLKDMFTNIYTNVKKDYSIPLDDYFDKELKNTGLYYDIKANEDLKRFVIMGYLLMDKFFRYSVRCNALKSLLEAGIQVQLFGSCQIDNFKKYSNLCIHGPVKYKELLQEISKSKILVHDTPAFSNGSHERVLSSMLNKTLVIANTNNYCNGEIKDGESIVYYDVNHMDKFIEKVKYYLKNDAERQKIVNKAYEIASTRHTWQNRAEELTRIYKSFKEKKIKN